MEGSLNFFLLFFFGFVLFNIFLIAYFIIIIIIIDFSTSVGNVSLMIFSYHHKSTIAIFSVRNVER